MASDPERPLAADDTVLLDSAESAEAERADEVTQSGDEWPVADLYYVEPDGGTSDESAAMKPESGAAVVPAASPRRRLAPSFDLGRLLAGLAVVAALAVGGIFLLLDEGEPAASPNPPTETSPATSPPETATSPPADAKVTVADVEGMALAEAREALEDQGLRVRVIRTRSERPRGEIVNQEPPADWNVDKGTVVVLAVSHGPTRVEVPDVVGLSVSRAVSTLREAGLDPRVRRVSSSKPAGTVVAQNPDEGTDVSADSVIMLDVARVRANPAVQRVRVPDVVGSTASAARSELRNAGFAVTTTAVVSQEPVGNVIEQSPGAGAELRKGATVKLTVSSGPAKVAVPDVTGLDEAAARSELERAGFRVRVTDESTTDPAQDSLVLRQSPAGGSSAEEGAVVTIVVGRSG